MGNRRNPVLDDRQFTLEFDPTPDITKVQQPTLVRDAPADPVSPGQDEGRPQCNSLQLEHVSIPVIVTAALGRAGAFTARVDGAELCTSRKPLLDAARRLIELGYNPGSFVEMWHAGADHFSLRARLGDAAKLTVDEHNGTVFGPWKPFPRSAVQPDSAQETPSASPGPPPPKNPSEEPPPRDSK
jgi:hypothetical protein